MNDSLTSDTLLDRIAQKLYSITPERSVAIGILGFFLIFLADYLTPPQLNLSVLYVPFIFIVAWNAGRKWGLTFALLAWFIQVSVTRELNSNGFKLWFYIALLFNRGMMYLLVVALTSPLRQMYDSLRVAANLDSLTGIPNRMMFEKLLERQITRNRERGEAFSVALIDCDRFKTVNDTLGHGVGDLLLRALAECLDTSIGQSHTVARLGGDEFGVILRTDSAQEAQRVMRVAIDAVSRRMRASDWPVTLSVGLGVVESDAPSVSEMMEGCDRLMYSVKARGRDALAIGRIDASSEISPVRLAGGTVPLRNLDIVAPSPTIKSNKIQPNRRSRRNGY